MGLRSRYAAQQFEVKAETFEEHARGLLELVEQTRPDVLLPLSTCSVAAVARNRDRMSALTAINVPAWKAFCAAFDKAACVRRCAALGIAVPRVYTEEEAAEALARGGRGGRIVVKPAVDVGGAEGVYYPRQAWELTELVRQAKDSSCGVMLQEYIPGGPETMRTVVALFSREGALEAAFSLQKLRQHPRTGGITVSGISIAAPELVEMVLPFFLDVGWSGPAEVELKWDAAEGRHKVIEINPRFPGYAGFARRCGLDFILLAVQSALEEPLTQCAYPGYRIGERNVIPQLFLQSVVGELLEREQRRGALRRAWTEWRGASSNTWALRRDPGAMLGRGLLELERHLPWQSGPSGHQLLPRREDWRAKEESS
jgi:predicted ATP-grasp superfamily ATP-dependent carboligase